MTTAYVALLLWLPVSIAIASLVRSPQKAFLYIFLGGSLLLPERMYITIPLAPPIDKHIISALAAWLGLSVAGTLPGPPRGFGQARTLLALFFVSCVLTYVNNRDTLRYGPFVIAGHGFKDSIWATSISLLRVVLPFSLAARLFNTTEGLKILLKGLVIGGLIYSPFVLLEARISPILHTKVYGYFQHEWTQAERGGGYRAFVFMSHGLSVAFFMSTSLIALIGLRKVGAVKLPKISARQASWILVVALISCKSLGSMLFAAVCVPLLHLGSLKAQRRVATVLAVAAMLYPLARVNDLIPTDWIIEQAASVSAERAGSIEFRFINENMLLEKAVQRPWFGWGWWGRNRVFNEKGEDLSVTDGEWIIHLGQGGILKFLISFGLLLYPVWRANGLLRKYPHLPQPEVLTATALLLAILGVDLIPNATSNGIGYVLAGALAATCAVLQQGFRSPPVAR